MITLKHDDKDVDQLDVCRSTDELSGSPYGLMTLKVNRGCW